MMDALKPPKLNAVKVGLAVVFCVGRFFNRQRLGKGLCP